MLGGFLPLLCLAALFTPIVAEAAASGDVADLPSDKQLSVAGSCNGYNFVRAERPFAHGHNDEVCVYIARGVSDGRQLVWKADPRAGSSRECEFNERLRKAGVRGPGCVATCEQGLLLDAVPGRDAATRPRQLGNVLADATDEGPEGREALRARVKTVMRELIVQTERMMLAGIVDGDRHAYNVLLGGKEEETYIIDFATFDEESKDFGSWDAIPCAHKVAMFGPITLGMGFCYVSHNTKIICEAAKEEAKALLAGSPSSLEALGFQRPETPQLVEEGIRSFLEHGLNLEVTTALHFGFNLADRIVPYPGTQEMEPSEQVNPSDEIMLEQRPNGDTVLHAANASFLHPGIEAMRGSRFMGAVRYWTLPSGTHEQLPPWTSLEKLDAARNDTKYLLLVFQAPTRTVDYKDTGLLPGQELVLERGPGEEVVVSSVAGCTSSGRPTRAGLRGIEPGWRLARAVVELEAQDGRGAAAARELPLSTDLREVDAAAGQGAVTLTFAAPQSRRREALMI